MIYQKTRPTIVSDTVDDETIIIDLSNGNYWSLNTSASTIWDGIEKSYSKEHILSSLEEKYNVPREEIESEVVKCLAKMEKDGLISESSSPKEGEYISPDPIKTHNTQWVNPEIKKYEDLQEMLMADPIHDVDDLGWPNIKKPDEATK